MYVTPEIVATFDALELLGEAYGHHPGSGNEGNGRPVGNGSVHSPI
jgi:hypothetical protein